MDDILKFQRLQQTDLDDILTRDKISCSDIDTNYVALGTENGLVHILNFAGQNFRSVTQHNCSINDIAIDNTSGLTVYSCSDNGNVMVLSITADEMKDTVVRFREPVTSIGLSSESITRKDKSFIVGLSSGKLILHRSGSWFSQKETVLFTGAETPITAISWKGDFVAWADADQVRVLDITTQSAICLLNPPLGVGRDDPYPCHLFWESSTELLIGWADSVRSVEIVAVQESLSPVARRVSVSENHESTTVRTAKINASWQTDFIVCGIFPFDKTHVILLGYFPPLDEETEEPDRSVSLSPEDTLPSYSPASFSNKPEVVIANKTTGEIVSADVLPLRGVNMNGPVRYTLLSTYQCHEQQSMEGPNEEQKNPVEEEGFGDARKWDLKTFWTRRGGDRGYSPLTFIVSPQDIVLARVRDVNDRITCALEQLDVKKAVELARTDRNSLRLYKFNSLIELYIIDLLKQNMSELAASECVRLIGNDPNLWECWIFKFIEFKQLDSLYSLIPIYNPRLSNFIYEEVLKNLLYENPRSLLNLVKKWCIINPECFNRVEFADLLEKSQLRETGDSILLQTLAQIYIALRNYEKALNCYLDMKLTPEEDENKLIENTPKSPAGGLTPGTKNVMKNKSAQLEESQYKQVFDLIERQNLFSMIEFKILNLVRLSKTLSAKLLMKYMDRLPIDSIAQQLRGDRPLLFWYLDSVFKDPLGRDVYSRLKPSGDIYEYANLHVLQVQLYAEFSPRFTKPSSVGVKQDSTSNDQDELPPLPSTLFEIKSKVMETDFILFLKSGLAPLDFALVECEKQNPPLYPEMIYINAQKGNLRKALGLILNELNDVALAINFIEEQCELQNKRNEQIEGNEKHSQLNKREMTINPWEWEKSNELWNDLIGFALQNSNVLAQLLDYIGLCKVDPVYVLKNIPSGTALPHLKIRLMRVLEQQQFRHFAHEKCNVLLESDALALLRQQNQGQRRAVKVESHIRCSACSRVLFLNPPMNATTIDNAQQFKYLTQHAQLWGPAAASVGAFYEAKKLRVADGNRNIATSISGSNIASAGVIIFSNKLAFHQVCFERLS